MKTTRQQILDLLKTKEIATATEICRALHITHANARHHLNILEKEGLVQVTGHQIPSKRGRPARQFRLSSKIQEHNLNELASTLLDFLEAQPPQDLAHLIANRLTEQVELSNSKLTLIKKLQSCIIFLNLRHYKSRWEAHTNAPHIVFEHCPYKQIITEQPVLCQVDARLLENLLTLPVEQIAKLEKTPQGIEFCMFVVKK